MEATWIWLSIVVYINIGYIILSINHLTFLSTLENFTVNSMHIIQLLFKRSFIPHAQFHKSLIHVNVSLKGLDVIKVVANSKRDADKISLLHLYRSLVRSWLC